MSSWNIYIVIEHQNIYLDNITYSYTYLHLIHVFTARFAICCAPI